MYKKRNFQSLIITVVISLTMLIGNTSVFAATQNTDAVCKNLINKMPDYKSSEYVFKDCMFDKSDNRYIVYQMANNYRYYYYYSPNGALLGTISMLSSKTNKDDVVFTAKNSKDKINYVFIADYYVVMSSRKVMFDYNSAVVYFPGGKSVTINTGQTGKLNNDGTFELKPNNTFGGFNVKKFDAYGNSK